MSRKYEKTSYIFCLILIGISIFIIARTEIVSRYILHDIRNELIPFAEEDSDNQEDVLYEMIPILAMNDEIPGENEPDLSYDDFGEYGYAQSSGAFSNVATATDSELLADNPDDEASDELATSVDANPASGDSAGASSEVTEVSVAPVTQGIVYSMEDLCDFDFLVTNCYAVDSSTSVNPDELDAENLLSMDMSIDLSGDDYKVLVYHTHGSEAFIDSREGVTEDTIIGVGDELTRILEEDYGIKTYHDRTVYDIVDGEPDRSYAYDQAAVGIEKILAENPSIEVVLDIHRDGVRDDVHLVRDIDGRPTAQIMFLNGVSRLNVNGDIDYLYNPYKLENLGFSLQMHLAGKQMYGDLMRRIYIRGYCFNLDVMPRASLVEVGAQTNTVEEAKNAMIPLGAIVYKVLSEK